MLTNQDILNSLNEENVIFKKLRTESKEFSSSINSVIFYITMIAAFITLLSSFLVNLIPKLNNNQAGLWMLSLVLLSVIILRIATRVKVDYACKQYPLLVNLTNVRSTWNPFSTTDLAPMREAYLYEKLLPDLVSLSSSKRKALISSYLKKGEKIKNGNWYIVTLLAVMLFAVWTGFIGAVIADADDFGAMMIRFVVFLFISLILSFFINFYKTTLEKDVLAKSFDYMLLSEMISKVDTLAGP